MNQNTARQLVKVLAILRALYHVHQTNHWSVGGPNYYGNHLLLQRLYEGLVPEIDGLGEKLVGYFGPTIVDGVTSIENVAQVVKTICASSQDKLLRSLEGERALVSALEAARATGPLPAGVDDWVAATANAHETNIYLLQRATSN